MPILQFKGKSAIETYHHTVPHHIFEFQESLSVLRRGEKTSLDGNLIIEGDNLLALKALLPTHAGRIKCIYIDPPYNTGNEGWIYNDNLTQPQFKEWIGKVVGNEEEDACRHDKWCCMMYPRLHLLKELLHDGGAIFISIDDNEFHNLRSLMDEVFGPENFVATIVWQNVYTVKNSAKYMSDMHDFVLLYAKQKKIWKRNLRPRDEDTDEDYDNPDDDPNGAWISHALQSRNPYSKGIYSIRCPGGRVIKSPPQGTYWRLSEVNFWKTDKKGEVWWGKDGNNFPRIKEYLKDVKKGVVPSTWWPYQYAGSNAGAKVALRRIMGDVEVFITPKPVELIQRIIELSCEKESIILDSFAGSGTTGHAVLEMNKDDGANRRFILVQMPYETKEQEISNFNLCKNITAERIKRVITGYTYASPKAKKMKVEGYGGSFAYATLSRNPLFGELRTFGESLPAYEEVAKYIFYTETSQQWDSANMNKKVGRIGEHGGTSYYLLYSPNQKDDWAIDRGFLENVAAKDPNKRLVVYCEKIWFHRTTLQEWERTTGKSLRTMIVPFNLR
jgi:adenine-specific DNA-methyltransferase